MDQFLIIDCGTCSSWNPSVTCRNTDKLMRLTITKCANDENDTYKLDSTGLEEGCIVMDVPIELKKEEMEDFLNNYFTLVGDFDCVPFQEQRVLCPTCNKCEEPGLC